MLYFGEPAMQLDLLLLAVVCQALSALPILCFRGSDAAQRLSVSFIATGSVSGVAGSVLALFKPAANGYLIASGLPFGPFEVGVDPLSAIFLTPTFIVTGCAALYGAGYWPASKHPGTAGKLTFFLGLLAASLTTLFLSRSTVLFLIAWEVLAFAAFFALTTEHGKAPVREAGILYLITAHLGALSLFATVSLLKSATGSYLFPGADTLSGSGALAAGIFLTALFGFGMKAGVMPLHVWLPSAHANAPSHISAVLSGIVLKTGIYGLMRVLSAFAEVPGWWGGTVLALGLFSAVAGVVFAIAQHDLKRLLAYHSIENIGIIMMGLGMALIGVSRGDAALAALGAAGALLHVVNHALFKALLFFAAGSAIHALGTRQIDLMGGVARRLPMSAAFFLVGAVAICGLPPLNGFVSELMIYLGSFGAVRSSDGLAGILPAVSAPVLALVGGLAVACFVKVYGVVFLGLPRSPEHAGGHEGTGGMLSSMGVLAACCAAIGLAPSLVAVPLENALSVFHGGRALPSVASLVPFGWLSLLALGLLLTFAAAGFLLNRRARRYPVQTAQTWGCGYLAPEPTMQYTASSFAATLVSWFEPLLRPERHRKEVKGLFPGPARHESHVPETVLEHGYLPFLEYLFRKASPVRQLQHGRLNLYIAYIFITLVVLLAITT